MNDQLTPPAGYESWSVYAIATMDTRDLYNDIYFVDDGQENKHGWPRDTQREDMRASAERELAELRQLAALGEKYESLRAEIERLSE